MRIGQKGRICWLSKRVIGKRDSHGYQADNLPVYRVGSCCYDDQEDHHIQAENHPPETEDQEKLRSVSGYLPAVPCDSPSRCIDPPTGNGLMLAFGKRLVVSLTVKLKYASPAVTTMMCPLRFVDLAKAAPSWAEFDPGYWSLDRSPIGDLAIAFT